MDGYEVIEPTVGDMKSNEKLRREVAHTFNGRACGAGRDSPQLRVNVLATTEKATIAALRAAATLAANLGAQITLIAIEVVPWQLPLQKPQVPVAFLERKLYGLVCEAGVVGEEVGIRLCLCRDQHAALRGILRPHSLVVIGGRNRWWLRRERKLKKLLTSLGHRVISDGLGAGTGAT
jgi:hypothetical protein